MKEWVKLQLPECGLYFGTGVYDSKENCLTLSGKSRTVWVPENLTLPEWLERVVRDNQGNTAQIWGCRSLRTPVNTYRCFALEDLGIEPPIPDWENGKNLTFDDGPDYKEYMHRYGAGMIKFIDRAKSLGIYTMVLCGEAGEEWLQQLRDKGKWYLGYDIGECYNFGLEGKQVKMEELESVTLGALAKDLRERVAEHVKRRKAAGWGVIMSTNAGFHLDYEVAGGVDVPVQEDIAFPNLTISSALGRGLFRQHRLPFWGSHIAHEHYSMLPFSSRYKFPLLKAAFLLKYMHGCKMIVNESGNWYLQSHYSDHPMLRTPRVELGNIRRGDPRDFYKMVPEARRSYPLIDYRSPVARKYRETTAEFYEFVREHGTPAGQPETTVAVVKGNYDICSGEENHNMAIAGAYPVAEKNPLWFEGPPEHGWTIVQEVFAPCPPVLGEYLNKFISGTPFGVFDIISFAFDEISAEMLNANWKTLIFAGWNTCSEKQYAILSQYVKNGGILCISLPHLSKNETRKHQSFSVEELVNGGDFSELCGVRVKGCGKRIHWICGPEMEPNELGISIGRRYGNMGIRIGDLEITDPDAEILAAEDLEFQPVILRRKWGRGEVYFINTWCYPGALDLDNGPGSVAEGHGGIFGQLCRCVAKRARGHVYITDGNGESGVECRFVAYSYFPDAGTICLYNIDFDRGHAVRLHHFGYEEDIALEAGEFRFVESVRLKPEEKLNWD